LLSLHLLSLCLSISRSLYLFSFSFSSLPSLSPSLSLSSLSVHHLCLSLSLPLSSLFLSPSLSHPLILYLSLLPLSHLSLILSFSLSLSLVLSLLSHPLFLSLTLFLCLVALSALFSFSLTHFTSSLFSGLAQSRLYIYVSRVTGLINQLCGVLERVGDHVFNIFAEYERRVPGVYCDMSSGAAFDEWRQKQRPRGGHWFDGMRVEADDSTRRIGASTSAQSRAT